MEKHSTGVLEELRVTDATTLQKIQNEDNDRLAAWDLGAQVAVLQASTHTMSN